MPLTKLKKQQIIEELKEKIARQKITIFVDFAGLKIKDFSLLRKKLKEVENGLKVAKKTLIEIAFKNSGIKINKKDLKGEIALVFGFKDEISPAKIVWQFSQDHPNLKIVGGIFENNFVGPEKIIEIAKLPTKEELLQKLINNLSAPIYNFVNVLKINIKGLLTVLAKAKT
jgi:large subunit ribosomal protein L10